MEEVQGTGKKKILWVSDLVTPTGFSRVAHSLIKCLQSEYDVVGVGVNYRGDPHDYDFPIFPANNAGNIYGENRVIDLLNYDNFDILYILNDSWVINRYLQAIKKSVTKALPKIVVYFPIDSTEHDPEWYELFTMVSRAVTYTEFGKWVMNDVNPTIDVDIIPHGIDTAVFYSLGDRPAAKRLFFKPYESKIGDMSDSFIVLNANRNQPRKRLDVTMRGFARFSRNKPKNVKLYMHCGIIDSSINVNKLGERYGISDRLIISSGKRGVQTVTVERLNEIYNICDVGINTSMGEGWGLTSVEHAVTGAVQLVPNHSSCRELFTGCGLLMNTSEDFMFDNSNTVGRLMSDKEVTSKLEYLYNNPEDREKLAKLGYEKFTSPEYSWEVIAKRWSKLFKECLSNVDSQLALEHEGDDRNNIT